MAYTEYLSEDILEDDYIKSFAPFYYIQMALGTSRIDIRDKFVSSPTAAQKVFSAFCSVTTFFLYIYAAKTYFFKFYEFNGIYNTCIASIILYYFTFLCTIIHVRFMNSDSNPKFYIQLQEIDRIMGINKNVKLNRFLFLNNLISVAVTVIILILTFSISVYGNLSFVLAFLGLLYSAMTCIVEWLYCADLMVYFYLRIRFINAIIKNHLEGNLEILKNKNGIFPTNNLLRCLASETHDFHTSRVEIYLKALIDGFSAFQVLYRWQIFLFCSQFVLLSLLTFEAGLMALHYNALQWTEIVALPIIVVLNLILALFLCIRCEVFFREMKQTEHLCIKLMSRYYDGPYRTKAKKMLKIIEECPAKFNVYNMWYMNLLTIIKMLNLVTTMMVALLQFAYL